jgi:hypothetical protein
VVSGLAVKNGIGDAVDFLTDLLKDVGDAINDGIEQAIQHRFAIEAFERAGLCRTGTEQGEREKAGRLLLTQGFPADHSAILEVNHSRVAGPKAP